MPAPRTFACGLALAALLAGAPAHAHQPGLSRLDLRIGAPRIGAELVFARAELAALVPGADADRSGQLDEIELLSIEGRLGDAVLAGLELAADDTACAAAIDRIAFVEEDGLAVTVGFTCAATPPAAVTVRLPLLERLAAGHRALTQAVFTDMSQGPGSSAEPLDFVLTRRKPARTLRRPTPAPASEPARAPAPTPAPPPARWPWLLLALLALPGLWLFRRRRRRS